MSLICCIVSTMVVMNGHKHRGRGIWVSGERTNTEHYGRATATANHVGKLQNVSSWKGLPTRQPHKLSGVLEIKAAQCSSIGVSKTACFSVHHCYIQQWMGCTEASWTRHSKQFCVFPAGGTLRVFDRPYLTASVYKKFANINMNDLVEILKQYFGKKGVRIADKLEFQACNTLHHHILQIDEFISAELPTFEQDRELCNLAKKFNMRCHLT